MYDKAMCALRSTVFAVIMALILIAGYSMLTEIKTEHKDNTAPDVLVPL